MRATLLLAAVVMFAPMSGAGLTGQMGGTNPQLNRAASLQNFRQRLGASLSRAGTMSAASAAGVSVAMCRAHSDRQLTQPDLALHRITGDGRCLFRALAQGDHRIATGAEMPLAQETTRADEIRSQVCDEMLQRRHDLAPFIDEDFDAYVAGMRKQHTWGGEPEVSVAPDVLQRPVDVFSDGRRVGAYEPSAKSAAAKQPVRLLFDGVGHYDLIVERQTASKL